MDVSSLRFKGLWWSARYVRGSLRPSEYCPRCMRFYNTGSGQSLVNPVFGHCRLINARLYVFFRPGTADWDGCLDAENGERQASKRDDHRPAERSQCKLAHQLMNRLVLGLHEMQGRDGRYEQRDADQDCYARPRTRSVTQRSGPRKVVDDAAQRWRSAAAKHRAKARCGTVRFIALLGVKGQLTYIPITIKVCDSCAAGIGRGDRGRPNQRCGRP